MDLLGIRIFLIAAINTYCLFAVTAQPTQKLEGQYPSKNCGIYVAEGHFGLNSLRQFIFTLNKGTPYAVEFVAKGLRNLDKLKQIGHQVKIRFFLPKSFRDPNALNFIVIESFLPHTNYFERSFVRGRRDLIMVEEKPCETL